MIISTFSELIYIVFISFSLLLTGRIFNKNSIYFNIEKKSKSIYNICIFSCLLLIVILINKIDILITDYNILIGSKIIQNYITEIIKLIIIFLTIISLYISKYTLSNFKPLIIRIFSYEYPLILIFSTISIRILSNSNDWIIIYISIEWISLCFYTRTSFRRGSSFSTEAGLKYYVIGAFGSAWILLGMSIIYGYYGSINLSDLERLILKLSYNDSSIYLMTYGWYFLIGSILLKLGAVPIHIWLIDVYEGAPTQSVLYYSTVPKRVLLFILIRFIYIWNHTIIYNDGFKYILIIISLFSILVGSLGALFQFRIKRFLAYSTVGHTGYILLGIITSTIEGIQSVVLYTLVYILISLIIWQFIIIIEINQSHSKRELKYITDLFKLSKNNPIISITIVFIIISMAGVPPIAGFTSKMLIFIELMSSSFFYLSIISVLISVISAYNYSRLVKLMYFDNRSTNRKINIYIYLNKDISLLIGLEAILRILVIIKPSYFILMIHRISLYII